MPEPTIPRVSVAAPFVDSTGRLTPEAAALLEGLVRVATAQRTSLTTHTDTLADHESRIVALEP